MVHPLDPVCIVQIWPWIHTRTRIVLPIIRTVHRTSVPYFILIQSHLQSDDRPGGPAVICWLTAGIEFGIYIDSLMWSPRFDPDLVRILEHCAINSIGTPDGLIRREPHNISVSANAGLTSCCSRHPMSSYLPLCRGIQTKLVSK
jgi:hypothetical protein